MCGSAGDGGRSEQAMRATLGAMVRNVLIDPDGTGPGWTFVVMRWPTGVFYQHQYGGTACRQGELEGYLVPVNGTQARPVFDAVFVSTLRRVGSWGRRLEPELLDEVRRAVGSIRFWPDAQGSPTHQQLQVDESALDELDEGWIPVLTSDGPGVLLWPNSD
jgi:hypothetical protein